MKTEQDIAARQTRLRLRVRPHPGRSTVLTSAAAADPVCDRTAGCRQETVRPGSHISIRPATDIELLLRSSELESSPYSEVRNHVVDRMQVQHGFAHRV